MQAYCFSITDKKMDIKLKLGIGIVAVGLLTSCNAIFEKDITGETPEIYLPSNNDTIYSNQVHFKWVEMEGASFYNLQVVQPSFNNIESFVLDSNINGEEFYQVLNPGHYQYRLRGENGGYHSEYAGPFTIYLDSVTDLGGQVVSLISPADGIYINGTDDITVSWQNLFAAENYEYILKVGDDFASGSILDQNLSVATLSYLVSAGQFDVEGTYFWGIKGTNLTGGTPYSSRLINVDLTLPNDPELISPDHEAIFAVDEEITLRWTTGTDPGTVHAPVSSVVEISASESFIDYDEFTGITGDSLVHSFSSSGSYWWRVKAVDEAGNQSEYYSVANELVIE